MASLKIKVGRVRMMVYVFLILAAATFLAWRTVGMNISMNLPDVIKLIFGGRDFVEPVNTVTESFHGDPRTDPLTHNTQTLEIKDGVVWVGFYGEKRQVVFQPNVNDLILFKKSWITALTFECEEVVVDVCDFSQPYKLYANNVEVEMLGIGNP